jgi:predicted nucleic acid-binding protein
MKLMDMNYESVVDSYAWIEYFRGTSAGEKAKEFIEKGSAATSVMTLAELREKTSGRTGVRLMLISTLLL